MIYKKNYEIKYCSEQYMYIYNIFFVLHERVLEKPYKQKN